VQGRISLNIGVVSTVPARKCPSLSSLHFLAGTVETTHHLATLCSPSDGSDYHGETLTKNSEETGRWADENSPANLE